MVSCYIYFFYRVAVESFKAFLHRSKSEDIIEVLDKEECWEMFEDEEKYPESVTTLCR